MDAYLLVAIKSPDNERRLLFGGNATGYWTVRTMLSGWHGPCPYTEAAGGWNLFLSVSTLSPSMRS